MDPANLGSQRTVVLGLYDHFIRAVNFMVKLFQQSTKEMNTDFQAPGSISLPLSLPHEEDLPALVKFKRYIFTHRLLSLGLWACYKGTQSFVYSRLESHLPQVVASTLTTIACARIRLSWTYLVTSDENERNGASMTSLFAIRRAKWLRFIATTILCDNFDLVTGLCLKFFFDAIAPFPSDEEMLSGEATIRISSCLKTAALILPTVMLLWILETVTSTCAATAALYQQWEVDKGWLVGVAEDIRIGIYSVSLQLCHGLAQDFLLGSVSVIGIALAPMVGWVLFLRSV
ncbi:hypothetical protein CPAR01_01786 [Colletotrichum paranaense]|uniref:Uncharacterized protein n=1 Tax=Colletotrichum paranaense TaxID=1914294 RepID=A0ABQ9T7Q3_9PEZI|nr:uncharacterized protein CPAR01_01786 [Colletotrichum paranaense]KAK1547819.1 hypothetical protein CPAR01_01786 [Colletotrichum paranaense]